MNNQNQFSIADEFRVSHFEEKKGSLDTKNRTAQASDSNLSGYWYDIINAGRYYLKHDSNGKISFQEYSFQVDSWLATAEGVGMVKGNAVQISYKRLDGTSGNFNGTISEKGKSINGWAENHLTGRRVKLHLNKE